MAEQLSKPLEWLPCSTLSHPRAAQKQQSSFSLTELETGIYQTSNVHKLWLLREGGVLGGVVSHSAWPKGA